MVDFLLQITISRCQGCNQKLHYLQCPREIEAGCFSAQTPVEVCLQPDYNGQIVWRLTCLPPDGQILVLLYIQHDLQTVPHPALLGFPGCGFVAVEGVAFPISGVNLKEERFKSGQSP